MSINFNYSSIPTLSDQSQGYTYTSIIDTQFATDVTISESSPWTVATINDVNKGIYIATFTLQLSISDRSSRSGFTRMHSYITFGSNKSNTIQSTNPWFRIGGIDFVNITYSYTIVNDSNQNVSVKIYPGGDANVPSVTLVTPYLGGIFQLTRIG